MVSKFFFCFVTYGSRVDSHRSIGESFHRTCTEPKGFYAGGLRHVFIHIEIGSVSVIMIQPHDSAIAIRQWAAVCKLKMGPELGIAANLESRQHLLEFT